MKAKRMGSVELPDAAALVDAVERGMPIEHRRPAAVEHDHSDTGYPWTPLSPDADQPGRARRYAERWFAEGYEFRSVVYG